MALMPERVADYPRPPALVASEQLIEVRALGELLVQTRRSLRVLETFHPPTYYLPPEAMRLELLEPAAGRLAGWYALYPGLMDGCWVDGEPVQPQPSGFYGGWITSAVQGPFKGDPEHPELI